MPRFQTDSPLYDAFDIFIHNCVLENRSLLWPRQNIWTPETVAVVKEAVYDRQLFGGGMNFEEKLIEQMKTAPLEGWGVLADIYYVYYLPSNSIKLGTKRRMIALAAEQGGFSLPSEADLVWNPLQKGFCHTGQRYNLKYIQFWALILFANLVKLSSDRQAILTSLPRFKNILDSVLESIPRPGDRGWDMRDAMLYMAFPDQFEPIISRQDKRAILDVFRSRVPEGLPDDQDEALLRVRQALSPDKDRDGQPFHFYGPEIRAEWKDRPVTSPPSSLPQPEPEEPILGIQQAIKTLEYTRNLILYGPPGTGKTFLAHKMARALVGAQGQGGSPDELLLQKVAETHKVYDAIALGLYLSGQHQGLTANEILELPIMQARSRIFPINNPREAIWSSLQSHSEPNSTTVNVSIRHSPALFDKDISSRWSLTPEGREYVEQSLAEALHDLRAGPDAGIKPADFISSVTFHQSYSYEDFIEGIRPKLASEEAGSISYEVTSGIFRRLCARAAANPKNKYVLLIDEINRGNIAKIFGELITLVEDDKRAGEKNQLSATLPYSGETLTVPGNLYLIGTMNTADRSIALLDVALRRRFAFLEVLSDPDLLGDEHVISEEGVSVRLGDLLRSLNSKIVETLDRDHQIGHSYFWKVSQVPEDQRIHLMEFIWNFQVLPLLEEYFHSQRARLIEILTPLIGDLEAGVDPESVEIPRAAGEDLVTALKELSSQI